MTQPNSTANKEPYYYDPHSAPHPNVSSVVTKEPVEIILEILEKL